VVVSAACTGAETGEVTLGAVGSTDVVGTVAFAETLVGAVSATGRRTDPFAETEDATWPEQPPTDDATSTAAVSARRIVW